MFEGKTIGHFKIERELGSGAMGAVYRAIDDRNKQYVAIKFIAPGLGENDRIFQRFEREAKMLQQLKHPNIVRRIGTGKYHKTPFYIMEYVEGKTLGQVLEERKHLPWDEVIHIGKQVASALSHAHSYGIIHRDLKPSNLMFSPDGTVKLTDFGIAKDLDAEGLTSAGCTVGTAAYMSPEQCQGVRDLTHKSDLYSLGIVFYELLTGKKPFFAENVMDMFMMHVKGPFERPSKHVMDIPVWLDTLVCQLMEKEPDKRPLNAAMVEQVLDEVVQKVENQKSVGASVAGKVALKAKSSADRKAAEMLLEAREPRRKRRRRERAAGRWRTALAALGLGAALIGLIAVLAYALWPDGPKERYLAAERLLKKGEAQLASDDPKKAQEYWYDAERELERIAARPGHAYADKAREQLEEIRAGNLYLTIITKLRGKSDWGELNDDMPDSKNFQKAYTELLKNYPRDNKYVEKTLSAIAPLHAPYLWSEAEKLMARWKDEDWQAAYELIQQLRDRYPDSESTKKALAESEWLLAWKSAEDVLKREEETKVARTPSLLSAQREVTDALALEKRDPKAAVPLWEELAKRTPERAEEFPWLRLAQKKAKQPMAAEKTGS